MAESKPQTLAGKLAIVSGSSKGLGAAIALELASRSVRRGQASISFGEYSPQRTEEVPLN